MIKSFKIMLKPNNRQNTKLFQCAGVARWAYNWTLAKQQENYKNGGKFILDGELRKQITQIKKTEKFKWLNDISNNIPKQAIKDACNSYKRFFKHQAQFPKFKSKKKSKPSFYSRYDRINFNLTHVRLEKFGWIKLYEKDRIPYGADTKYINPRVSFDGIHWWISVGVEFPNNIEIPTNQGIGIDIGIKDLAICSDKNIYKNINKTKRVKKSGKKRRRLQRQISRKYLMNKEGSRYKKTCNIIKLENKLLKLNHRLANIRHNYLHQTTTEIIKRNPSFIVLEDLNVKGMMKNKHLAKAIQQQCFYEFYRQIQYKSEWNNIKFIVADRWYPSSKICSECGHIKKDLNLSDREWICPSCGTVHDRDYNASVNLRNYGQSIIAC
jgi:putative transposase